MAFGRRRTAPLRTPVRPDAAARTNWAATTRLFAAYRLYRADPFFRGLTDLAVTGSVILAVSGFFTGPIRAVTKAASTLEHAVVALRQAPNAMAIPTGSMAGAIALGALEDRPTIKDAGALPQSLASKAGDVLKTGNTWGALQELKDGNQADPAIRTARAVVLLNEMGFEKTITALKLLRTAANQGYPAAFTLLGRADLKLLRLVRENRLPVSALTSIDATGEARPVSPDVLLSEALDWFERGAAFGEPAAIRALGAAQALGFGGKPNLQAAIAHFRDAAARGDGPAATELGFLYSIGAGVAADPVEAERLLRVAAASRFEPADLFLAIVLMRKAAGVDLTIAQEAFDFAYRACDAIDVLVSGRAQLMLGRFYLDAAPPALRSMTRAADHVQIALTVGNQEAALDLSRMFRLGLGVPANAQKARELLDIATAAGFTDAAAAIQAETASAHAIPDGTMVGSQTDVASSGNSMIPPRHYQPQEPTPFHSSARQLN